MGPKVSTTGSWEPEGHQEAASLTATDRPTGRRTIVPCYLSIAEWSYAQSDGPSLLVKQPPGLITKEHILITFSNSLCIMPLKVLKCTNNLLDSVRNRIKLFLGGGGPYLKLLAGAQHRPSTRPIIIIVSGNKGHL